MNKFGEKNIESIILWLINSIECSEKYIYMYEKSSIFSSSKRFILEDNISIYATLVSKPQFKQQQKSRRKAV